MTALEKSEASRPPDGGPPAPRASIPGRFSPWTFATLALLLLGLLLKLSLLVYAMYVLLGVLLLSRFFTRHWAENVKARRSGGRGTFEIGDSTEIEVSIENASRLSIPWILLEDALPREALTQVPHRMKAEGTRLVLARLSPGQSREIKYRVQFLMRGYYQLGPLTMETGDVFGLHRRFNVAAEPHFALVMPKVLPLQGYNLATRRPMGEIRVTHRLFEDPTRMAGVRPYQQGDPLNRIHWRATARSGQLHSRVYENSRIAGATFLLDFHEWNYPGDRGGGASAELAVTTVASLANAVFLMGQQIGLVTNGRDAAERIRAEGWGAEFLSRTDAQRGAAVPPASTRLRPVIVETGKGLVQFNQILETLARLEHTDGLPFEEMVEDALPRIPRDATVVPVLRNITMEGAVMLGALRRRGFLVTAIVVSAGAYETPDWAHAPEWAEMLLSQGIDFRLVNSEEAVTNLCAEAIVK